MPPGVIPFPFGKCRVCRDRATGVHYGVATCEGCKGFFKRSTLRGDKYKCFFGGQCDVGPQNRNRCKSCRFRRCLESGMAIDAVKMGRIPKLEKERALAEARMNTDEEEINPQNNRVTSTTRDVSMENMEKAHQIKRMRTEHVADANREIHNSVNMGHADREMHNSVNMGQDDKLIPDTHRIHIDASNSYHNMQFDYSNIHSSIDSKNLSQVSNQQHSVLPNPHASHTAMQMCQRWVDTQTFEGDGNRGRMIRNQVLPFPDQHHICRDEIHSLQTPMENSHLPAMSRDSDAYHRRGDIGQGNLVQVKTEIPYHYDYSEAQLHTSTHSTHYPLSKDGALQNPSTSTYQPSSKDIESEMLHSSAGFNRKGENTNNISSASRSGTATDLASHEYREFKIGQDGSSALGSMKINTEEDTYYTSNSSSPQRTGYSPSVIKVLINKFMEANKDGEQEGTNPISSVAEEGNESSSSQAMQQDSKVASECIVWKKFDSSKNLRQSVSPKHMIERKLIENEEEVMTYDNETKSKSSSGMQRTASVSSIQEENIWEDYKFLKTMVPDPIFGNLPLHVRDMEMMKKLGQEGILERLVEFPIDMIMSIADKIKDSKSDLKAINRHGSALGRESELIVQSTMVRLKQVAKVLLEPLWQKRCYVRQYWQGRQQQAKFTTTNPEDMDGIWATLMKSVNHFNEIIIGFCKNVPGFAKLNSELKEFLVERVYFDIWMLNSYEFVVDDTSYMVMPNGEFYSKETMMYILKEERVKELLDVAETLNNFHLTDLELMLLCVVQLTCPDDIPAELKLDPEPLRILNLHYLDILANVISHNYGQKCSIKLVKIFQFLPKLTRLTNKLRKQVSSYVVDELPNEEKLEDIFHESDKVE